MPFRSQPPWLDHSDYTWRKVQDYFVGVNLYWQIVLQINRLVTHRWAVIH
jgi:hypothetical protein